MNLEGAKRNKLLIITYVFPPAAYVGVYRTLKYCRYLGMHGWVPLVLTIKPSGVLFKDEELCQQIPEGVEVYRTADVDPAKWLDRLSRWRKRSPSVADPLPATTCPTLQHDATGIFGKIKAFLIALLTASPDSHIFWVPFAFFRGIGILLRRKVDVIYSTSPPHSSHIAAYLLAKLFRKPYILDFRDPWVTNGTCSSQIGRVVHWVAKLESMIRTVIIRNAAKVITASKGERNEIAADFPEVSQERFSFITNGFDSSDFSSIEVKRISSQRFTITHAGTIYGGAAGEFFGGLELLLKQHHGLENFMQVRLMGEIADEYFEAVRILENKGLVQKLGLQPHATALRLILESDLLVILLGGDKYLSSEIPAKTFEYLYAEKPIIAVTKRGDLAEILEKSGLGVVVAPGYTETLAKVLWDIYSDYVGGRISCIPNRSYIQSFERTTLTEKLAKILNEVMELQSEYS